MDLPNEHAGAPADGGRGADGGSCRQAAKSICVPARRYGAENGAKAVAFELTKRRVTREFFATHSVSELEKQSDYWLEQQGRLTEPMRYDPATDHYVPIDWSDAFALIARELNALRDPNEAEFYTSGRTSNEAAFMYQLFARRFGTNNFPDCSNMCHEPTSVGLPESIGVGKGTVVLDDFAHADAIFIVGQNPGTNSPRMMTELHNASRRGVPIVVFNPLRERALERFAAPQNPVEMVTFGETRIASEYCQVRVGGGRCPERRRETRARSPRPEHSRARRTRFSISTSSRSTLMASTHSQKISAVLRGMTSCPPADWKGSSWSALRRFTRGRALSSSAMGWELPNTDMARRTSSISSICCCCGGISANRARAYVRCAATRMCRAIERWVSTRSLSLSCWINWKGCSGLRRRTRMDTTWCMRSRQW